MKKVNTPELEVGMKIAQKVENKNGMVLLPEGIVLTDSHIARLKKWGVESIFVAILLYAAYKGFSKGIVIQAASLVALILGIYCAIKFSGVTATFLIEKLDLQTQYISLIAFAVTFVGIVILVHLVARIIDKFIKAIALGFVNRAFGGFFAVLKTAFIISIVLVIVNNANKKYNYSFVISPVLRYN